MMPEWKRKILHAVRDNLTKNAGSQPPVLRVIQGKKEGKQLKK